MDILVKLIKNRKLGKLCRIGAGVIVIIGAVQIITQLYNLWQMYHQISSNAFQGSPPPQYIFTYIPSILVGTAGFIFYAIILYCASVVFEALADPADAHKIVDNTDDDDIDIEDGRIVYKSLKPEEILQSRKSAY